MTAVFRAAAAALTLFAAASVGAEFDPTAYAPSSQAALVRDAEASAGKKFRVTDTFQYCGSDFCVQVLKTKFDTRRYYCFAVGPVCLIRMYLKKDHPDAPLVLQARRGDLLTVYGTYDRVGADFHYMLVDRVVRAGKP